MDRFQTRNRRNRASTPNLKLDVTHKGHLLLRREFKRYRPARGTRDKAKLLLLFQ